MAPVYLTIEQPFAVVSKTSTTEADGGSKRRKKVTVSLGRLQLAVGNEGK
jgi:hypothetical protein